MKKQQIMKKFYRNRHATFIKAMLEQKQEKQNAEDDKKKKEEKKK
jgi:hypothetical protein